MDVDEHAGARQHWREGARGKAAYWIWHSSSAIGTGFIAISAFVFVFTFPHRLGHYILIEALVGTFSPAFALVYLAVQLAVGALMRSWQAAAIVAVVFVVGMGLAWIGMHTRWGYMDVEAEGFTAARHILCGGSLMSGFVLGLAMVKGWFWRPEHR